MNLEAALWSKTFLRSSAFSAAVFVMRATGLFSYYFQRDIGLGDRREENVPAGFWVRYLALMFDLLLVVIFI